MTAAICDHYPMVSKHMSNFPSNADVIFKNAMYPLRINCCNATESTSFSKAFISCRFEEGFPLVFFTDLNKIADYLCNNSNELSIQQTEDIGRDVKHLEIFLSDSKKHESCIFALNSKDDTSEYIFEDTLDEHLFGPLSGDQTLQIGNKDFDGLKKCQTCQDQKCFKVCDTSFGNSQVWHGYADIFVKRSIVHVVKMADDSDEETIDESYESSDEVVNDKTSIKRRRTDSAGDDSNSYDSSIDFTIAVKEKDSDNQSALSQALAQTIVNAFCVSNENPSFSNAFIPSFIATNRKVRISMYNCEQDVLFLSNELDIFVGQSFNFFTIFVLWYFLNFKIVKVNQFIESNFKEIVGKEKLIIYKTKVSRPMVKEEDIKLELHVKRIEDPVMVNLFTSVTAALGKLKKLPSKVT